MIVYEHGVRKHKVDEHEQQRGGQYLRSLLFHAAKLPRIREIRKRAGERPVICDKCGVMMYALSCCGSVFICRGRYAILAGGDFLLILRHRDS